MCCSYLSFLLGPNENKKRLKMFLSAVLHLLDLIDFDTLIVKMPVWNIYLVAVGSPISQYCEVYLQKIRSLRLLRSTSQLRALTCNAPLHYHHPHQVPQNPARTNTPSPNTPMNPYTHHIKQYPSLSSQKPHPHPHRT